MHEQRAWMALPGYRSLYAKVRTNNYLKFQLDNGTTKLFGRPYNLYAGISAPHNFKYISSRVGLRHISKTDHIDVRLKMSTGSKKELSVSARGAYRRGNFCMAEVAMFDVYNFVLNHFNTLVGYKIDEKIDIFLRA